MSDPAPVSARPGGTLVVVTGSGRSGTSTVAGTLKMLGTYVPQPEISPNEANPRGYFEPKWTVAFHKKVLQAGPVRTLDGRPAARELMAAVTGRDDLLDELRSWFADQLAQRGDTDQVVVKDPRIVWLREMWARVAADLGVETRWLTMLRHPAEVVGSRDRHYLTNADDSRRLARETANLAGWVNVGLTNERASRGDRRAFVHYTDLITDWRTTMAGVGERLGLAYDADLTSPDHPPVHHPVDDFIDAGLRRVQVTLDDLDVPAHLRTVAETVWTGLDALSRDPDDEAAMKQLDAAREDYDQLFVHAEALVQDATDFAVLETRRQVRRRLGRQLEDQRAATAAARAAADDAERRAATPSVPALLRRVAGKARRVVRERRA